jgi:hypothetical protein
MTIEELLERPYWVLDILPAQVPADGPGQYFAVERYYLQEPQLAAIKRKHLDLLLKLNCYRDVSLDEDEERNPPPEQIADTVFRRYTYIRTEDAMLLSEPDDTHMTLFNPDEDLLDLVKILAAGEGLFVWQPQF